VSTIDRDAGRFGATLTVAIAIFKKQLTLMIRYPINLFSGLLTMYVFFAMIFFGGQAITDGAIAENLEGLIIGFFLWSMAWSAFADLTWNLTREAQWGTLEQLYMTVHGFEFLMALKSAVNILLSFLTGALILGLMILTTGEMVIIDVVTIVPIIVLGLWSVVGVGFIFGGLAIIYKRIERVFQILSFGFIGLIGAPVGAAPLLKALPLTQGSYLLRRAMKDGERLWEMPAAELGILVAVAVGYFLAGALFFRFAQRRARKLGVMGHY